MTGNKIGNHKEPLFSVIMPTYNRAYFTRRAISSLVAQTYNGWELIIIDDGSKDNTEEFASEFLTDKRIKYIKNNNNRGLGHAINQGLDMAKYEYIAYLPADDYYSSFGFRIQAV